MNDIISDFVKKNYKETKADLFACFIVRSLELTKKNGMIGFVTPFVWMFISSFEWLRKLMLEETTIQNLIQLEYNAFEPACVPVCSFTLRNEFLENFNGDYIKLSEFRGYESQPIKTLEAIRYPSVNHRFIANQNNFKKIPGSPIAYWVSERIQNIFASNQKLYEISEPRQGMATTDNEKFLRRWFEVSLQGIAFNIESRVKAVESLRRWFPYNKGGEFRKWFGNNEYIVDYNNDGEEMRKLVQEKYRNSSYAKGFSKEKWDKLIDVWVLKNKQFYFRKAITYSFISSTQFSVRFSPIGFIFDVSGSSIFPPESIFYYVMGLLISKLGNVFLQILNPTMNYQIGDVASIPIIMSDDNNFLKIINQICVDSVKLSNDDWDAEEISWDFKKNELLRLKENGQIQTAYNNYCNYWREQFFQLHKNEEELNRIFIEIYGLQDELTPDVDLKDITILKQETDITEDGQLVFKKDEIIKQFISYAVGCMFGRYSLDKEGLILANQGETLEDYLQKVPNPTFMPDEDAIIPVLEDDYFVDDITGRFRDFLKLSFGEEHYNENIAFIEDALGKDIRKYFAKDFYADHIKRYKKRPIYWMFSSPKKSFNALIYMHRYRSDTVSKILNDYLREFQEKLKAKKQHLTHIVTSESSRPADKTKAQREINKIEAIEVELQQYEREILYPLAAQKIEIDLDDGVKVNYNKFGKALQKVAGLSE